jgi:hypothetical protein
MLSKANWHGLQWGVSRERSLSGREGVEVTASLENGRTQCNRKRASQKR